MNNMVQMNTRMFGLVTQAFISEVELTEELGSLIEEGFVEINDCYFLESLYRKQAHISMNDFSSQTTFECFINSLHVDDFVDENVFSTSLLFIQVLLAKWRQTFMHLPLKIILSETEFGFNIKWYLARSNDIWIDSKDLPVFDDAIMMIDS